MLRAGTQRLDAVLYTHAHKDHTAGMDDIRAFNYRQQQDMPLYGTQATLDQLRQEFAYVFAQHKYPGIPQVRLHPITQEIFRIGPAQIVPLPVRHHRMPVLGFRFGPFAYITDANHIPPETFARLRGVEVLVLNALRQETHLSHFTLAQAVEIAQQVGARQTWLTHISHLMGRHHDVNAALPPGVALAHDGLVLELAD
jgi:phosphoribosyl 1,2-cyclic phosphate phosphodiesterase